MHREMIRLLKNYRKEIESIERGKNILEQALELSEGRQDLKQTILSRIEFISRQRQWIERYKLLFIDELKQIPDRYSTVIKMRYIDGMDFDSIADNLHYTEKYCRRLAHNGLQFLSDDEEENGKQDHHNIIVISGYTLPYTAKRKAQPHDKKQSIKQFIELRKAENKTKKKKKAKKSR